MPTDMVFYYTSQLSWHGGKRGTVSAEGLPEFEVATPPEFRGPRGLWSPEQLFVAAANTSLMTTFLAVADKSNLAIDGYSSSATGKLAKVETGSSLTTDDVGLEITEIVIRPRLTLATEGDRKKAESVLAKAEEECLISRSMKARVTVRPVISLERRTANAERI